MHRVNAPRPFPWSSLPSITARDAAATREALRRLAPSPPRPAESLSAGWRALLGGEPLAAPGAPALLPSPEALPREVFTAVLERDDGALVLAMVDRTLARAVAARALSLPALAHDAPITAAEEGALMALCARLSALACAPGPPHRVRAVTDDPDDALHALRDATPAGAALIRWPWAVRAAEVSGLVTLVLPPRGGATWSLPPRASVLGASVAVLLVAGRARWTAREIASLDVDDLLALDGLRCERGALLGGVDLCLGAPDGPAFSGTLSPLGARIDAPACLPGDPVMHPSDPSAEGPALDRSTLDAVPVSLTVEIARRESTVGEVAAWRVGAVVEFATGVGDPALLRAGGRVIARGELVDVEGRVGLRVTEVL